MSPARWFAWGWLAGIASAALFFNVASHAGTATLNWTAPTKWTDGTPITTPLTYNVYRGTRLIAYGLIAPPYVVYGLAVGTTACFTMKAKTKGILSDPSNVRCKSIKF